jgi:membrane protein DedA with SNARE-associated domain/membrane-associated phospholipid phosphatase
MLETYAHGLITALHAHPNWGYFLTFFVAFVESLAVIGTIVPGSVTMTAIGALVGARVMPASWTLLIAILGALTGDLLSYWVGKHYDQRLTKMWPFNTHPQWIIAGKLFFEKHGGKSVIIGRFFGPVRSFVPLIAGLLQMHPLYFLLAAIPSATLWAIAYLVPGILLGALSMELPPSLASKFVLYVLIALVVIWLLIWFTRFIAQQLWGAIDLAVNKLWTAMRARKAWHFITTPLADPREPDLHDQLMLAFSALAAFSLLLIFLWNITHHGVLTAFNQPIHTLLQSIRTPLIDSIMTLFTLLGDRKCILSFAVVILGWLTWQRNWRAAAHWLALMILVIGSALAIKYGYYSPRPSPDLPANSTSSLPSGHTIFTLAFFGFLSVLISHELPHAQKKRCYKIALTMVLLAAFSRIYLGPHWLTDIIVSFLLGLVCVLVVTISYRRHLTSHISPKKLSLASIVLLLILWSSYSVIKYSETFEFHRQHTATLHLTSSDWWQKTNDLIPTIRHNRLSNPIDPLNIEWQGSLPSIKKHLENQGWKSHSSELELTGFLERLSLQESDRRLPLLPQLYHNHAPALLMTKLNQKNRYEWVLYLWASDIQFIDSPTPLWIGTLKKYENPHEKLFHLSAKDNSASNVDALPAVLDNTHILKTTIVISPAEKHANTQRPLQWNGKILQLSQPKTD